MATFGLQITDESFFFLFELMALVDQTEIDGQLLGIIHDAERKAIPCYVNDV